MTTRLRIWIEDVALSLDTEPVIYLDIDLRLDLPLPKVCVLALGYAQSALDAQTVNQ